MCAFDDELAAAFEARKANGLMDSKCHIDVNTSTHPDDVKRAGLNAFSQDDAGTLHSYSLKEVGSFEGLLARII